MRLLCCQIYSLEKSTYPKRPAVTSRAPQESDRITKQPDISTARALPLEPSNEPLPWVFDVCARGLLSTLLIRPFRDFLYMVATFVQIPRQKFMSRRPVSLLFINSLLYHALRDQPWHSHSTRGAGHMNTKSHFR